MERGGREPRLATILRLANALGVQPGTLLDELDGSTAGQ
jgi:transcriptional regulator with XRE-family HTH domain